MSSGTDELSSFVYVLVTKMSSLHNDCMDGQRSGISMMRMMYVRKTPRYVQARSFLC